MSQERLASLVEVLEAIRWSDGATQVELVARVRQGRSVVAQRVAELESLGLVATDGLAPSTGGRAARRHRLRADAGTVVGVDIAARELRIGITDLAGRLLASAGESIEITDGPETVLDVVHRHVDELVGPLERPPLGIGVGLPGPVEFATGLPSRPPIMPSWDGWPVTDDLSERYGAPAWADNDVNLRTLAELRTDRDAAQARSLLYLFVDVGIGAGIAVGGRIYRGATGSAGDIGHVAIPEGGTAVCRCGNIGCLEAVAGAAALEREARLLAQTRQSPALARVLERTGALRALDVTEAAAAGDPAARALLHRSGRLVGGVLATLVSFFNPDLVVVGGGIARAREFVVDDIRQAVEGRSLPLSTQDLRIEVSELGDLGGVVGAAHLAVDQLLTVAHLDRVVAGAAR